MFNLHLYFENPQTKTLLPFGNMSLWKCENCGLFNYPINKLCKACFNRNHYEAEKQEKQYKS